MPYKIVHYTHNRYWKMQSMRPAAGVRHSGRQMGIKPLLAPTMIRVFRVFDMLAGARGPRRLGPWRGPSGGMNRACNLYTKPLLSVADAIHMA